ncbi:hypothetical protein [Hymenobacter negativus]|uniref:hypothetical protein n=1 Tax=Hymenobacter negativus TaxID=2795026 RepID=UPI001AAF14F7|nr:hypothetical protein [Hymenobacter negativus]
MKRLFLLLLLAMAASPTATAQTGKRREAKAFRRHFQRLDSLTRLSPNDTVVWNCSREVAFVQTHTGIDSNDYGNYAGLSHCYKSELWAWHAWYTQQYESRKWYARNIQ